MIEIPRSLLLRFRSVCRRLGLRPSGGAHPAVYFEAGADGLRLRAFSHRAAVEYVHPGQFATRSFSIPLAALADAEGTHQTVELRPRDEGGAILQWSEGAIPRTVVVDSAGNLPAEFPAFPSNLTPNPARFHTALRHAVAVADRESSRYALNSLQLDADAGRIVVTDGRQLLVQRGFNFPWQGQVLIPASKVFAASELTQKDPVAIGRSGDWIAFTFGNWVIYLPHDPDARFPAIDSLLADPASAKSTLTIAEADAAFLVRSLEVMPGADQSESPVTVDLNGHIALRSRADADAAATEVVLSNSQYTGQEVRGCCDRRFLSRALKFGFRRLGLNESTAPMFCDDGERHFLWMQLADSASVPPDANATRIESPLAAGCKERPSSCRRVRAARDPSRALRESPLPAMTADVNHQGAHQDASRRVTRSGKPRRPRPLAQAGLLDEAIAVRDALRDALTKSRDLVRAIKRHKRQNRIVESTLASLKQLQHVA